MDRPNTASAHGEIVTQERVSAPKDLQRFLLAMAASGLFLQLCLPLGILSEIRQPAFFLAWGLHLLCLLYAVGNSLRYLAQQWLLSASGRALALLLACVTVLGISLHAFLPISARDALIHHLAVPRWWLESGRIYAISWHDWSFYPMLVNLGFTGLLALGLEALTPFYHCLYLVLLCATVARLAICLRAGPAAAFFAAVLCFSLPLSIKLASAPLVDLGLAAYFAAAFLAAVHYAETKQRSFLVYTGIFFGLALSCKYNALLGMLLAGPALLVLLTDSSAQHSMRSALRALAGILFVALLVYSPWLLKNWLWTGNPLYPLLGSYFGTASAAVGVAPVSVLEHRLLIYGESWWEILLTPLLMLFRGEDGNPRRYDGVLSPLLILLAPAIFYARSSKPQKALLLFTLSYLAFTLVLAGPRVRYLAPILGPIAVLCGIAANNLNQRRTWLLRLLLALQLAWTGYYLQHSIRRAHAIETLMGKYSKQEYLSMHVPEYSLIEYANQYVEAQTSLMPILTSNAYYFYRMPLFSGGHFSAGPLLQWIRGAQSIEDLREELRARSIGYLLIEHSKLKALLGDGLDQAQLQRWNEFSRAYLQRVSERGSYSLWKIAG